MMSRMFVCLSLLLTGLFAFTVINLNSLLYATGRFTGYSQTPQHPQRSDHQRPAALFDGYINPSSIPDHVAYDILFRIFSASEDTELDREKKKVYAQLAGFNENEANLFRYMAYDYEKRVRAINERVKEIKDRNWPNPGSPAIVQLQQLKGEKQNLISAVVTDMQIRASANNMDAGKVQQFIVEYIKPRIKGYATDPSQPKRKVGSQMERISGLFTSYAQASYCGGYVYAYSNTTYSMSLCYLWGDGSYYAEPDSCGHTYNTMVTTTGPGGIYQSSSSGTSVYLIDGSGFPIAGSFFSETDVEGFCSIVNQAFSAAFAPSQNQTPLSVRIASAVFPPPATMDVSSGSQTLTVEISPSNNLPDTSVRVEITQHSNLNSVPLTRPTSQELSKLDTVSGGSVKNFTYPFATAQDNAKKGPIFYRAEIVSAVAQGENPPQISIMGDNPRISNELCVGSREGAPPVCPYP
ncbi:MAG: hypothetical protein KIT57_02935 [Blastocatellales bacterium]|nr:hypothetical protein [Blastocatellales bacterium]